MPELMSKAIYFVAAVAAGVIFGWLGWMLFSVIFLGAGGPPR